MSVAVTCPQCQARFEISEDLADQPVQCDRCEHVFRLAGASTGIQTKLPPVLASAGRKPEDEELESDRPRRHPTPRSPFPWTALLVIAIGLLFLLLAFSIGFNVWFLARPDNQFRMQEQKIRADQAMEQRLQAEQAAEMARVEANRARENQVKAQANLAGVVRFPDEAERLAWGTLEGRVVWKGELPKVESLEEKIRRSPDKDHILKAPKEMLLDPTWRIDPNTKGVANVAVFIKRPADGILPIHPDDKILKQSVVMDAPFCVYAPHMVALYPAWYDGKDRGKTGQKFIIKNSSPLPQNARITGDPKYNDVSNSNLPPSGEKQYELNPQPLPVVIQCDFHTWMHAYAFVFDHPYYAITKADGTFTIPRVPAGMEVQVMAWHESQGWLLTNDGRKMKLTKGKNSLDFAMSAN